MKSGEETRTPKCRACRGRGRVLLLESWAECLDCKGSGVEVDEDATTGKHPAITEADLRRGSTKEGSGAQSRCEPDEEAFYFDDERFFCGFEGFGGAGGDLDAGEDS